MGGMLDATNILDNQAVSVISKISHDHQNFLGTTLDKIARHKAGILRPGVPYIVNPVNEWSVQDVIRTYAEEIGAGPCIIPDTPERRETLFKTQNWTKLACRLEPFQRDNAILGYLAVVKALESIGQSTKNAPKLLPSLKGKTFTGRLDYASLPPSVFGFTKKILVDGAHNADAASELKSYARKRLRVGGRTGITWVLAMTRGKDVKAYLEQILEPQDSVVTTSFGPIEGMPWVESIDPAELKDIVLHVRPEVKVLHVPEPGPIRAICAAKYLSHEDTTIVLTGSLYLVGEFVRDQKLLVADPDSFNIEQIDREERIRVLSSPHVPERLSHKQVIRESYHTPIQKDAGHDNTESLRLMEEIDKLNQEIESLEVEETRLRRSESIVPDPTKTRDFITSPPETTDPLNFIKKHKPKQDSGYQKLLRSMDSKLTIGRHATTVKPRQHPRASHDNANIPAQNGRGQQND